jgi:hypothetical protein
VDPGSQRWETAMKRVLELNGFGVQKSIGRIAPATPTRATQRTRKRADSLERIARSASDAPAANDLE